jgi:hypothetical protein
MHYSKYNIILIKIIRAIILFVSIYVVTKYFTIGKIPYNEIFMICSSGVLIQTLLDIYRPIIIINENELNDKCPN